MDYDKQTRETMGTRPSRPCGCAVLPWRRPIDGRKMGRDNELDHVSSAHSAGLAGLHQAPRSSRPVFRIRSL